MSEEFIPTTTNSPSFRLAAGAVPTTTNRPTAKRSGSFFTTLDNTGVQAVDIPNESGILTPAPGEPITLERAKEHLRVVITDEDDHISSLIVAARAMAEGRLNRTLVQRQITAVFGQGERLQLLKPPIVSVDSMEYLDVDGALQSFEDFDLAGQSVMLKPGVALPASRHRPDAIRVTYTAGYAPGEVPAPIVSWMLLVIGTLYANRESLITGSISQALADNFAGYLLQPYMVYE